MKSDFKCDIEYNSRDFSLFLVLKESESLFINVYCVFR